MHDIGLNRTSNVFNLTQFNTTKNSTKFVQDIDGEKGGDITDFFVADFSDSELKQIRLRNKNPTVP